MFLFHLGHGTKIHDQQKGGRFRIQYIIPTCCKYKIREEFSQIITELFAEMQQFWYLYYQRQWKSIIHIIIIILK